MYGVTVARWRFVVLMLPRPTEILLQSNVFYVNMILVRLENLWICNNPSHDLDEKLEAPKGSPEKCNFELLSMCYFGASNFVAWFNPDGRKHVRVKGTSCHYHRPLWITKAYKQVWSQTRIENGSLNQNPKQNFWCLWTNLNLLLLHFTPTIFRTPYRS